MNKASARAMSSTLSQQIHKEISEIERENVGVETAHKAEQAAERVIHTNKRVAGAVLRFHRNAPHRRAAKLGKRAMSANVKASYQKAVRENPKLKGSALSRFIQRRKIKRQHAQAYRQAQRAGGAIKRGGSVFTKATQFVSRVITRNPKALVTLALMFLVVVMLFSIISSCSSLIIGGFTNVLGSSHLAESEDINNASIIYTQWENELRQQIENVEADHPGYDEYRFFLDEIGHDPRELMAFLTAVYHNFQFADVYPTLRELFNEQYQLEFIPEVEIRTRTVTNIDPDTGESYEDIEEYEWHILNIILTVTPLSEIIAGRMDDEQREHFDLIMESGGNRQYITNPFAFDWTPFITSHFGYHIHPISGVPEFHTGIDIAVPQGTPILAGQDGIITLAGPAGDYGLMVAIDGGAGIVSRYAHCSEILVSVGQHVLRGDVIARVGSTGVSTGPHLHLEVIVNGVFFNPIFFAESR